MLRRIEYRLGSIVILAVATATVTGCSYTPLAEDVPIELPQSFSDTGEDSSQGDWWESFGSDQVNELVDRALVSNMDLKEFWYRMREAQSMVRREKSSSWPFLDIETGYRIQRPESSRGDILDLGLSAGYELDLWGRIRYGIEEEQFLFMATEEDFQAAALSISAEVVLAAFRLTTVQRQSDLIIRQLETNSKVLQSLRNRFGSGQSLRGDILQQQQFLEQTRSELIESKSQQLLLRNQLSVLMGKSPGTMDLSIIPDDLPPLPPMPETGVPAQLLQKRPDVMAAYNRLMAADKSLAVAVSERYPRISISGSAFTEDTDSVDLFDDWLRTLAANLALPLFDGGRRQAEVERAEAARMQQLAGYSQTLLQAVREVEDALIRETKQRQQLENVTEQVRLAEQTYQQVQRQYLNGVSDFLEVLTALSGEQRLRRQWLSEQLELYEYRIALYRSLAGKMATDDLQIEINQKS